MKAFLTFALLGFLAFSAAAQTADTITGDKSQVTSNEFTGLLQTVKNQDSESVKTETLKNTFINSNRYYSTAQVRKLLELIPKDSGKLAVARSAYDRVTDPDKFAQLDDLFSSSTYKKEFIIWVQNPDK